MKRDIVWICGLLLVILSFGDCQLHKYTEGDNLSVWVNRVGPFHNPQEYYMFHNLPYCRTDINRVGHFETLGESLLGYELRKLFVVGFKEQVISQQLCEMTLDDRSVLTFRRAIDKQYWFQVFADDLPVWGVVGEKVNDGAQDLYYLYGHLHFDISYNGENIVEVNMTSENAVELTMGAKVPFSYSVQWVETKQDPENRFDKYLDTQFFEHQIHWFSVLNSFMLVIFLLGLISLILLKTLRKEYNFSEDDSEEKLELTIKKYKKDPIEDSGWKLLHREVFRCPSHLVLFAAILGTGYQLLLTSFFTIFFEKRINKRLGKRRGSILSTFCTFYILFSFVSGYSSGSFYIRNKGSNWIKTALLTSGLLPFTLLVISIVVNIFAKSFGSLAHIPVATYLLLAVVYVVVTVIVFTGTLFGRHWSNATSSVRVNPMPRLVPPKPWFLSSFTNYLICGILPFASIFIELYFLYTALWHYKYYYVFGYLFLSFLILILVVASVSVISTYFLLNNEDHSWQWRSLITGSSVAFYVFVYSVYYYYNRTSMKGFLQFVEYFGDVSMITITLAILCSSISFYASHLFVRRIYQGLKSE